MISYDNFTLDDIGEVSLKQMREFEDGDAPQRAKVTLKLTVDVFQRGFAENYALIQQLRNALKKPNALLVWANDDTDEKYINQTVTSVSDDLPEEWGEYHQSFNLTFIFYEALDTALQNLPLTFKKTGATVTLNFTNVRKWAERTTVARYSTLLKQRKEVRMTVSVEGLILGDTTLPLETRRSTLASELVKFRANMNAAEGQMNFGVTPQQMFAGKVRIEDFSAEVDHAICAIPFSFTASYVLFPDQSNYALVEFDADEKDNFTGETTLSVTGKITSESEVHARARLEILIAAVLAQYGYNGGTAGPAQQMEFNTTPHNVDADADGPAFMELTFTASWRKWRASNQPATFCRTGSNTPVSFGQVRTWEGGYKAQRFDDERSQRRHVTGTVAAAGTWPVDPTMSLKDRRAALLRQQRAMETEVNCPDGKLVFGDWTQVVRIEELTAKINQAETGIEWSFSASYSIFPNEGGYATCQFTAEVRDDVETGDSFLVFAGEILAPNASLARAKLNLLRTGVLRIYGYKPTQRTRGSVSTANLDANGDKTNTLGTLEGIETGGDLAGSSFLRLPFNEEYRQRTPGNLVSSTFNISSRDDTATGLVLTTYSGSVVANGPTTDAAIAAAVAQAMVLGANKELSIDASAFLRTSSLDIGKRQLRQDNTVEFLRVSFTYEYQSKMAAGRAYLEMSAVVASDTFGSDSEAVSGFVVAVDFATANAIYQAQIRAVYKGRLIRNETLTRNSVKAQRGSGYVTQPLKLDFMFTAHRDKPVGKVGARYSLNISRDNLTATKRSRISGSVFALNAAAADAFVNALLDTFGLGTSLRSERAEDHETDGVTDAFMKYDFTEEFEDALRDIAGIIECRLSESVTYSSTRFAVQDLPFNDNGTGGVSIPQPCGIAPGNRTVRGSVVAVSLATAEAWAWRQRAMLTGDATGSYPGQPQLDRDFEFVPRTDGIPTGDDANVKLHRVNFSFSEILPNYPAPV